MRHPFPPHVALVSILLYRPNALFWDHACFHLSPASLCNVSHVFKDVHSRIKPAVPPSFLYSEVQGPWRATTSPSPDTGSLHASLVECPLWSYWVFLIYFLSMDELTDVPHQYVNAVPLQDLHLAQSEGDGSEFGDHNHLQSKIICHPLLNRKCFRHSRVSVCTNWAWAGWLMTVFLH